MDAHDQEEHSNGANMTVTSPNTSLQSTQKSHNGIKRQKSNDPSSTVPHTSRPGSVTQSAPLEENNSTSESLSSHNSRGSSTSTTMTTTTRSPSIDEQVKQITELVQAVPTDGQKGYVVASAWLKRVQARSSTPPKPVEKSATEGDIGPVDNSDIAMVSEESGQLKDDAGEPFVMLRPGVTIGEDCQVLPEEAWDLVVSWYGLARTSPIITRYAHQLSEDNPLEVQYELYPCVFTFLKVPGTQTPQVQREADLPPPRMASSRHTNYMRWLKAAKALVNTNLNTKVKVWRILGGIKSTTASGILTPVESRSASPAPGAEIVASAGPKMLLNVHDFALLAEGDQKQLIEHKDQTADIKYNGRSELRTVGLEGDAVIVLEEETGTADVYASEKIGVSLKGGLKAKGLVIPGRAASPVTAGGVLTRGRAQRQSRPKGIVGLTNLGNTCYMNSALQCVRSVEELTEFFRGDFYKRDLNYDNPLGYRGQVAKAYGEFVHQIYNSASSVAPSNFKKVVGKCNTSFAGYGQQDSQEFIAFLLDGMSEDLNRIKNKPYIQKPDSTDEMVEDAAALKAFADRNWHDYKARNDSVVTDLFAGMYKSTLTCPVCHKVSIVFDPFNNLTLQLPIENNWSKEIIYYPLYDRPFKIDVDIDKNGTILDLKLFCAKRTGHDASKMICAEAYKYKFFKIFDNTDVISECSISANEIVCVYELSDVPTNYNPDKQKKFSQFSYSNKDHDPQVDPDSPQADRLLVPVFHRHEKTNSLNRKVKQFFGLPSYVVLSRRDRSSYDRLMKKLLGPVLGMTTVDILAKEAASASDEDSDTLLVSEDSSALPSPSASATSVQGDDSLVDVSMRDTSSESGNKEPPRAERYLRLLRSEKPVPSKIKSLFAIKYIHTDEGIVNGWNSVQDNSDFRDVHERAAELEPRQATNPTRGSDEGYDSATEDTASPGVTQDGSDEISESGTSGSVNSDEDVSDLPPPTSMLSSGKDSRGASKHQKKQMYKRKGRRIMGKTRSPRSPKPAPQPRISMASDAGLILPGDAIILDWEEGAWEGLFGGSSLDGKDEFRGQLTHEELDTFEDKELEDKRQTRNSRKKNGVSLEDCLREYGKPEILSEANLWYCPRCKEHRRAEKKFELWKVPDILVMHLKRFSSSRNFRDKLDIKVDYPVEGLDLSTMVRDQTDGKSLTYDLIAVDCHFGGLGGGHYTAMAKNSINGEWYDYNDSHVSKKSPEAAVDKSAYLLFYRRRQDSPLGGPTLERILEESQREDVPNSREVSPSGEGQRLGDFSHNGSSSASADQAHRVGGGGLAATGRNGLSPGADFQSAHSIFRGVDDDVPPAYGDDDSDMLLDEEKAVYVGPLPYNTDSGWSFGGLAQPTNSEVDDQEFGRDLLPLLETRRGSNGSAPSSTGGMGGSERSYTQFDDAEAQNADDLRTRESAPAPEVHHIPFRVAGEQDEEELEVKELRIDEASSPRPL